MKGLGQWGGGWHTKNVTHKKFARSMRMSKVLRRICIGALIDRSSSRLIYQRLVEETRLSLALLPRYEQ